MDPETLANAQRGGLLDAVPGAELSDRGVVADGQGAERIARLDCMELAGGLLGSLLRLGLPVLDFGEEDLHKAIASYQSRQRRYGKTEAQIEAEESASLNDK